MKVVDIFKECENRVVVFDGAMGTQLQERGLKAGECPEYINLKMPEVVFDIHKAYIEAGAEVIETNTFGANRIKLAKYGLEDKVEEIVTKGVEIARKAAGDRPVALSVGPTGELLAPFGDMTFDEAYEVFKEVVVAAEKAGADIVIIETMSDMLEAKAAILAAKENTNMKVICTMTFQEDGRTLMGSDPVTVVVSLQGLGLDAIGVNCSTGPDKMVKVVEKMAQVARIPIIAQPNAGMPVIRDGKTVYDLKPEEFASFFPQLVEKGACIVGGCCGTTPYYIKLVKKAVENLKPKKLENKFTALSSNTRTVFIGKEYPLRVIGERINPTGKKKLSGALLSGDVNLAVEEALKQQKCGAEILDVNVGVPGIEEEEMLPKVAFEVEKAVDLPLQLDSTNVKAIEKAIRILRGRPIINSVNAKEESLKEVLPIVKKYGACVVGLTVGDKGLPKDRHERVENARKILKKAEEYGIPKEDVIIDPVVLTVSSEQGAAIETLEAMKIISEELGVNTVVGLSNISFGLPERKLINSTFLAMAASHGLTAAIVNPCDESLMDTLRASMVLLNKDKGSENYLKVYGQRVKPKEEVIKRHEEDFSKKLYDQILEGKKSGVEEIVMALLEDNPPLSLVDEIIIPALKEVGDRYEKGIYFLPQLLSSAEVVQSAFKLIKEKLPKGTASKGKIILATVEGDVHDIGKNIVKVLLENYGYEVIDLGKDVKGEVIVEEVKKTGAPLVGLSALMTTTLFNMEKIIKMLKENTEAKVMVGGAVLTEEYAFKIGADYYGKTAQDAVKIADKFFLKNALVCKTCSF
ncbi:MAG: Methionine synthase I, cobalamin-binding domain protein [Caldanaerobacter subterraneus]|nr:MAG: Methionine synthase I, cobalamin-binding domain protein [Caldanaerobacter subterraneus]MCS3915422.1 5-methyltetrahydrofolate--homocysteine methyltransferase [Caldanaerobacter subterraneus subsp. tengcongensis MB4]